MLVDGVPIALGRLNLPTDVGRGLPDARRPHLCSGQRALHDVELPHRSALAGSIPRD